MPLLHLWRSVRPPAGPGPRRPSRRWRGRGVALAVAASTLAAAGCTSVSDEPGSDPTGPVVTEGTGTGGTGGSGTTATTTSPAAELHWVVDTARGLRLTRELVGVPADADPVRAALEALLSETPSDGDHVTLIPRGTRLRSIAVDGSRLTLDVTMPRPDVGAEGEQRLLEQLLWTAHRADPTITELQLRLDGAVVESLAGHVDTSRPVPLGDAASVYATVEIVAPDEGDRLRAPVTVRGWALTFEANVVWELRQGSLRIAGGNTTAFPGPPERGRWDVTIGTLPPGRYEFVARDVSAEDGSIVTEATRSFVVDAP